MQQSEASKKLSLASVLLGGDRAVDVWASRLIGKVQVKGRGGGRVEDCCISPDDPRLPATLLQLLPLPRWEGNGAEVRRRCAQGRMKQTKTARM